MPCRDAAAPLVAALTLATALVGCADDAQGSGTGTGDTSTGSTPTTSIGPGSSSSSTSTGADSTSGPFTSTSSGTEGIDECTWGGGGFIYGGPDCDCEDPPPECTEPTFECDLFAQDCPEGEKCMPWAADGGPVWNGTRCSEIMGPGQLGEECTVEGWATYGIDDCDIGLMCWDVDPATNTGTCVAMCQGNERAPICAEGTACAVANDGTLILCLDECEPLLQDCAADDGCYPVLDTWVCIPDASGPDGAHEQACEHLNGCDPGLVCANPLLVPDCPELTGCCTELCSLTDPAGDAQCAGEADGQQCLPLYEAGMVPAGLEDVGVCAIGMVDVPPKPITASP